MIFIIAQRAFNIIAGRDHTYIITQHYFCYYGHEQLVDMPKYLSNQIKLLLIIVIVLGGRMINFILGAVIRIFNWDKEIYYPIHEVQLFHQAHQQGHQLLQFACGNHHSISLIRIQDRKQLFVWGESKLHQLTLDTINIVPYPVESEYKIEHIKQIYSKNDYNIIVNQLGICYSWGANLFNRLGYNLSTDKILNNRIPKTISISHSILKIGIGLYHVVAVTNKGYAYSWGHGLHGQLGINQIVNEIEPTRVLCEEYIVDASCGEQHSLILLKNGNIMSCGSNSQGALGHQCYDYGADPNKKRCKIFHPINKINHNDVFVKISAGDRHSLALIKEGIVYGWGCNRQGQLGPIEKGKQSRQKPNQQSKNDNQYKQHKQSRQNKCNKQQERKEMEQQLHRQQQYRHNNKFVGRGCPELLSQQSERVGYKGKQLKIREWKQKYQKFIIRRNEQQNKLMQQLEQIMHQNE